MYKTKISHICTFLMTIGSVVALSGYSCLTHNTNRYKSLIQDSYNPKNHYFCTDSIKIDNGKKNSPRKIIAPIYNLGMGTIFSASERSEKSDSRWLKVDAGVGFRLISFLDYEIGIGMRYFYQTNSFLFPFYGGGGFSFPIKDNRLFLKVYIGGTSTSSQYHFDNGLYIASQIGYEFSFLSNINAYIVIGGESIQNNKAFLGIFAPFTSGSFLTLGLSY